MPGNSQLTLALHILTLLAMQNGPVCSSAAIAGSVNTNPVVARRVLGVLREAGMVESVSGGAGGFRLAQPAESISVADVYRAVGAEILFALHHQAPNPDCPCGANIQPVLADVYQRAAEALEQSLRPLSIADLARAVLVRQAGGST